MARKKTEIALQQMIETQEEWEESMTKEGLMVIDVFQEWAGPCKAMLANFRRIRNELSDDLLHFAMAKADTIDSLERYRGKCQPCFLFYAGGCLVAVVRGANAPLLSRTVLEELKKEHKVLKGEAERVEIRDPLFAHLDSDKSNMDDDMDTDKSDEPEMVPKEVTVALIKPDIVRDGKAEEVLERLKESGIEILKNEERKLSDEEARNFYDHLKNETFFDELIEFMCSGPSHVLLLSKPDDGKGIINEWRELIGPTNVEEAKEKAPDSLRAKYGTKEMLNALHGSDSHDAAAKELAFFFPEYSVPRVAKPGSRAAPSRVAQRGVQRTLALIRPDVLVEKKDEILQKIEEAGFEIALQKEVQLTQEQVEGFYEEHKEQPYFDELIAKMTSGPVLALGLARNDAISEWRTMLGPTSVTEAKEQEPNSLRAQYALGDTEVNMLHGSDSPQKAQQELNFFFPMQQTLAVIKPDAYENKDNILSKIKEAGFHVAARKETTLTKDIASMLYKQNEGEDYFGDLIEHMTSGPTLFMVLTKEDAVDNWRGVIGPTDPLQAKENAPNSIRAQFGSDVKANAVHGATSEGSAKVVIQEIFGDLKTKPDGTVAVELSHLHEGVEIDVPAKSDEESDAVTEAAAPAEEHTEVAGTETDASERQPEESAAEDSESEYTEGYSEEEEEGEPAAAEDAALTQQTAAADEKPPTEE
ncbi:thioredoxin domain-containing protein 3 homolog isoform X2 [Watersipora subatra]|uniref:thioredoxin domain-containing protein 3 homolog isoform X2 n=1 Tax=Watersipora subatra TaxID=2589382 RepID=UPI00355B7B01